MTNTRVIILSSSLPSVAREMSLLGLIFAVLCSFPSLLGIMSHRRDDRISRSIVHAIQQQEDADAGRPSSRLRLWRPLRTFFRLYGLVLVRYRPDLFRRLRSKTWGIKDDEYKASFKEADDLVPKGDMGYSGSVGHPGCIQSTASQTNPCRRSSRPRTTGTW